MHSCEQKYYCLDKELILDKYATRWLSRTAYEESIGLNIPIDRANIPINSMHIGVCIGTNEEGMKHSSHEEYAESNS
jgi:hypothetical protein